MKSKSAWWVRRTRRIISAAAVVFFRASFHPETVCVSSDLFFFCRLDHQKYLMKISLFSLPFWVWGNCVKGFACRRKKGGLNNAVVFFLTTPSARLSLLPLRVRGRANDLCRYRGNRAGLR